MMLLLLVSQLYLAVSLQLITSPLLLTSLLKLLGLLMLLLPLLPLMTLLLPMLLLLWRSFSLSFCCGLSVAIVRTVHGWHPYYCLLQLHSVSMVLASLLLLGFNDVLVGFCALLTLLGRESLLFLLSLLLWTLFLLLGHVSHIFEVPNVAESPAIVACAMLVLASMILLAFLLLLTLFYFPRVFHVAIPDPPNSPAIATRHSGWQLLGERAR
jgi:hypothetical protein